MPRASAASSRSGDDVGPDACGTDGRRRRVRSRGVSSRPCGPIAGSWTIWVSTKKRPDTPHVCTFDATRPRRANLQSIARVLSAGRLDRTLERSRRYRRRYRYSIPERIASAYRRSIGGRDDDARTSTRFFVFSGLSRALECGIGVSIPRRSALTPRGGIDTTETPFPFLLGTESSRFISVFTVNCKPARYCKHRVTVRNVTTSML